MVRVLPIPMQVLRSSASVVSRATVRSVPSRDLGKLSLAFLALVAALPIASWTGRGRGPIPTCLSARVDLREGAGAIDRPDEIRPPSTTHPDADDVDPGRYESYRRGLAGRMSVQGAVHVHG